MSEPAASNASAPARIPSRPDPAAHYDEPTLELLALLRDAGIPLAPIEDKPGNFMSPPRLMFNGQVVTLLLGVARKPGRPPTEFNSRADIGSRDHAQFTAVVTPSLREHDPLMRTDLTHVGGDDRLWLSMVDRRRPGCGQYYAGPLPEGIVTDDRRVTTPQARLTAQGYIAFWLAASPIDAPKTN